MFTPSPTLTNSFPGRNTAGGSCVGPRAVFSILPMRLFALRLGAGRDARVSDGAMDRVAAAKGGDRNALEALIRDVAKPIHTICRHVVGETDAPDAVQETLMRVVVNFASYDSTRGAFRPWAFMIARNVCRDRLRRRGVERGIVSTTDDLESFAADGDSISPEDASLKRVDSAAMDRALATLPEPVRTALVLFHVNGSSYEEIAAVLEVPMGTVMTWLHRGRKRLKAAIENQDVQEPQAKTVTL